MAVQAGYLSNQILQHPLPPQSLVLLNNLLQHIKSFQMLTQAQQQMGNSNSPTALQLSVQITKAKQHIQNLHNQIAAQQAHHAKQQQAQHHGGGGGGGGGGSHGHLGGGGGPNNDFFKAPPLIGDNRGGGGAGGNLIDPLTTLQNSFGSDFLMNNKEGPGGNGGGQQGQGGPHQQSRLSQWTKIPSLEKDDGSPGNEFSRAPGPQSNNGGGCGGLLKSNSSLILGGPSDK
jgi:trinucleotide repeat-containing gene 6 protein